MAPLTALVHFHCKTFLTTENADCMVCLEKVEKGVFHLARNTEKEKKIAHVAHMSCLKSWILDCGAQRKLATCPYCKGLIAERSLQQVFTCFSANNLTMRSFFWHSLFKDLLEKAPQHQENKKEWKDQAEIIIDELRFVLDGIHRFYISSQKKDWIEEPLAILAAMQLVFDVPRQAIRLKNEGLVLPDHLDYVNLLTPSMEKHVLKVIDFLSACIDAKKQMLTEDACDKQAAQRGYLYFVAAGALCSVLAGMEVFNYFDAEETNWKIVFSKITGMMIFLGGVFKAVTHAQEHFTSCFRKLSITASPASIGEYGNI